MRPFFAMAMPTALPTDALDTSRCNTKQIRRGRWIITSRVLPWPEVEIAADSLLVKGAAYRALGQFSEAERSYRQALVADENSVDVWFNLGNVLRDLMRPSDAIEGLSQSGRD